jgi:hypothetical protein
VRSPCPDPPPSSIPREEVRGVLYSPTRASLLPHHRKERLAPSPASLHLLIMEQKPNLIFSHPPRGKT